MSWLKKNDSWPVDSERLEGYTERKLLFKSEHQKVFKNVQDELDKLLYGKDNKEIAATTYLVANYCGLISRLSADLLFGENPVITSENEVVETIIKNNRLYTMLYESALGGSYRGDSVLKIRRAVEKPNSDEKITVIEPLNPRNYFVEHDPDNIQKTKYRIMAREVKIADFEDKTCVRVEVHEPGMIYNFLYLIEAGKVKQELDVKQYLGLEPEDETGIPEFLIYHIPNYRLDEEYWGIHDYVDILTLQDEANNRFSQIAKIMDKHADPKMRGPAEAMETTSSGEKYLDIKKYNYFPYKENGVKPEYITWEAQLDHAFKEIDYILKMMFMVTETSPAAFGLEEGGVAESGRALKFRLMRTLAKTARKKRYYDYAIKKALEVAQMVEQKYGSGGEVQEINIEWRDGLPDDPKETAEETEILDRAGAISLEQKIRKNHPNWTDEEVNQEVNRIKAEQREMQRNNMIAL